MVDWESISREVVSLFTSLTDHPPMYIISLDWNLVCKDFNDEDGWTKWTCDGNNLHTPWEEYTASFLIFSESGLHQMFYHMDKRPEIKHLLELDELSKFKTIKSRHDRLDIQIKREKDFYIGKMEFLDSHKLRFSEEQWDYLSLRRHILLGKKLVLEEMKKLQAKQKPLKKMKVQTKVKTKAKTKSKAKVKPKSKPISVKVEKQPMIRSDLHKDRRKPEQILVDDYEESIENAKDDIKALKNRENRKLANNALEKMADAVTVIKRCDRDVHKQNERIKKLRQQLLFTKRQHMRKLAKKTKLEELDRKIEMVDRMNEKELLVKTQKVREFCGLREAILTIRTNEEKLSPNEVNLLIDKAYLGEMQKDDIEKMLKKLDHYSEE
jgi:hypothetical protein